MSIDDINLDFRYPGIFLVLTLLLIYFAVKWYYSGRENILTKKEQAVFGLIKLSALMLVVLLFFDPVITVFQSREEGAKHLFLLDNSRSMVLNDSSSSAVLNKFARKYEAEEGIEIAVFGDSSYHYLAGTELKFQDSFSDLFQVFHKKAYRYGILKKDYRSVNIISDGFFNRGENPRNYFFNTTVNCLYPAEQLALRDLSLAEIDYADEISADDANVFEVTVKYEGERVAGKKFVLKVSQEGRQLTEVSDRIPAPGGKTRLKFTLAKGRGEVRKLTFQLKMLAGEKNHFNNSKTVFQRVVGTKSSILILNEIPSFDLRFLKQFLGENEIAYDVATTAEKLTDRKHAYDLLILLSYPAPATKISEELRQLWADIDSKLIFVNGDTDLEKLNKLSGLGKGNSSFSAGKGTLRDSKEGQGSYAYLYNNELISLEQLPEVGFNRSWQMDEENFFAVAKIASGQKQYTSVWQSNSATDKVIYLNIDPFWKLMFSVKGIADDNSFAKFMLNLIDYLTVESSGSRLTVKSDKDQYYSGEQILFSGTVLDRNFKKLKQEKVRVEVMENSAETYLKSGAGEYRGQLTLNEPGIYSYLVTVEREAGEFLRRNGTFKIVENDLESSSLGANRPMLKKICENNDGLLLPLDSLEFLLQKLDFSPRSLTTGRKIYPLRNIFYFLLLIILLAAEWLYRKIKGMS